MLITAQLVSCKPFSYLIAKKTSRSPHITQLLVLAKKRDFSEPQSPANSSKILLQSTAVGVFALGFIDAGYSGDWSRIGAISRETEDLLKAAAFLVVPLCLFLIFSLFYKKAEE